METRTNGETAVKLLDAASEVFAEKGFHEATIAEICQRAGANIASVNYYFRSKEKLYVEAWRRAFRRGLTNHPLDGGLTDSSSAADRLRAAIESIVRRMSDPKGYEFEIVHHEHVNPTGLLAETMGQAIRPLQQKMRSLVRALIGPAGSELDVALCQEAIMGQCLHILLRSRPRGRCVVPPLNAEPGQVAEHVYRFSLAGIGEIRRLRECPPNPNNAPAGADKE